MQKKDKYNVAIVGATGMVGRKMMKVLEQRNFPVDKLVMLASERSSGLKLNFKGEVLDVQVLDENSFQGVDIALFSAGASISKKFAPIAAGKGVVVIDNSSAFRMDKDIPLVVPEVNPDAVFKHNNIIANPNCSTIQMVVALKPIHDIFKIKRIVVSTYQSVAGWGKEAVDQLEEEVLAVAKKIDRPKTLQSNFNVVKVDAKGKVLPFQIAFNLIPHIDVFLEDGSTKEEEKMVNETKKIMEDHSIKVTATCVRVPVLSAHSEAVNIETEKPISAEQVKELLSQADGVAVVDDTANNVYPLPIDAVGQDLTYVGRIRKDNSIENGINMWIVSDNLRKGAALNAVQIAELLISK